MIFPAAVVIEQCFDKGHDAPAIAQPVVKSHPNTVLGKGHIHQMIPGSHTAQRAEFIRLDRYHRIVIPVQIVRTAFFHQLLCQIGKAPSHIGEGSLQATARNLVPHPNLYDRTVIAVCPI